MTEHTNGLNKRSLITAILCVILAVGLMVPVTGAHATPTAAEKQAEAEEALDKLNEMQEVLDKASNDYFAALDEVEKAEAKVAEAQVKIDEETAKIEALQTQLGDRARSMYRNGTTSFLDIILGAATFDEFANNLAMLDIINQNDARLVQETKDARAALEAAKVELEEQQRVAEEKAEEAKRIMEEAEATTAEMQEIYDNLSAEAEQLLREEEEARERAAQQAAQNAIAGSGSSAGDSKVQTVTGNIIVDRAYAQLGKPYRWGAVGPNSFDCSGLVGYCITGKYSRLCTTYTMANWTRVSNPQPGDFCLNSHHTGIYIGNGQMIHAPRTGDVVKISGVHAGMWYVRY